jgi:non-specific serine/threonine protein kinase
LGSLGWVAMLQGEFEKTHTYLDESLGIRIETGDLGGIAWCLEKFGEAFFMQTQAIPLGQRPALSERAARLFGAAFAIRESINSIIDPVDQQGYEENIQRLTTILGTASFKAAWTEGSLMPLEKVREMALSPVLEASETAETSPLNAAGLTPRERQTAHLIAQGKSNREIAEIMVIRVKTAETYVTRILNKLGFHSRVQIATWYVESGLKEQK